MSGRYGGEGGLTASCGCGKRDWRRLGSNRLVSGPAYYHFRRYRCAVCGSVAVWERLVMPTLSPPGASPAATFDRVIVLPQGEDGVRLARELYQASLETSRLAQRVCDTLPDQPHAFCGL